MSGFNDRIPFHSLNVKHTRVDRSATLAAPTRRPREVVQTSRYYYYVQVVALIKDKLQKVRVMILDCSAFLCEDIKRINIYGERQI